MKASFFQLKVQYFSILSKKLKAARPAFAQSQVWLEQTYSQLISSYDARETHVRLTVTHGGLTTPQSKTKNLHKN